MFKTLATIAMLALPTMATAGDWNIPGPNNTAPPVFETFFFPRDDGNSYTLRYVNLTTGSNQGDTGKEELDIGTVTWSINHTPNATCEVPRADTTCSDTIIVTVPDGYIAIPSQQTILERTYVDILIVPELFS